MGKQHEQQDQMKSRKQKERLKTPNVLPASGLVRLAQIVGDWDKGVWPPIVPVSRSSWWAGVASGRYPAAVKLGERTTCWRVEDIRALIGEV